MDLITPKTPHSVLLRGMKSKTEVARIGSEVLGFLSNDRTVAVTLVDGAVNIKTVMGSYVLQPSPTCNRYEGKLGAVKAHVILNKISGKLIYWF